MRCEGAKGILEVFNVQGKYLIVWIVHLGYEAMGVACMLVIIGAAVEVVEVKDDIGLMGGIAGPHTCQR